MYNETTTYGRIHIMRNEIEKVVVDLRNQLELTTDDCLLALDGVLTTFQKSALAEQAYKHTAKVTTKECGFKEGEQNVSDTA